MGKSAIIDISKSLEKDNLSFIYHGDVNDKMTEGILKLTEHNAGNINELTKIKKKMSAIIVECFQNLVRHGNKSEEDGRNEGIFVTRSFGHTNYFSSVNKIEDDKVDSLKTHLDKINQLSDVDLKAMYRNILLNEDLSSKGGAGLGLIDLARKSGEPLEYDFDSLGNGFSNFYLSIKLKSKDPAKGKGNIKIPIGKTKKMLRSALQENIILVYKGDFAQGSILPILNIIEDCLKAQDNKLYKKIYLVLVEVLQNISKHAKMHMEKPEVQEGIFMVAEDDKGYLISAGNQIDKDLIPPFEERLEMINKTGKEGLNELYIKTLKEGKLSKKGGAGLGLIEIARTSKDGHLNHSFTKIDAQTSFFIINVRI